MKITRSLGFLAVLSLVFIGFNAKAQDKSNRPSPPMTATAEVNGGNVTIDYSSPGVKERTVWGELVPYDKVWRTGANEATTLTVENAVTINGNKLPAGKYGLFTIPGKDEWTVIINSVWDQWGAYNYDKSKDVMRFTVKPHNSKEFHERMTFEISDNGEVTWMWENKQISFKIK